MTAYVRDVEHLEELIDRFAAYGQTTSVDHAVLARLAAADRASSHLARSRNRRIGKTSPGFPAYSKEERDTGIRSMTGSGGRSR